MSLFTAEWSQDLSLVFLVYSRRGLLVAPAHPAGYLVLLAFDSVAIAAVHHDPQAQYRSNQNENRIDRIGDNSDFDIQNTIEFPGVGKQVDTIVHVYL